ncbi:MAG: hypothetical protein V7K90_03215 [Nostoc sp.]
MKDWVRSLFLNIRISQCDRHFEISDESVRSLFGNIRISKCDRY